MVNEQNLSESFNYKQLDVIENVLDVWYPSGGLPLLPNVGDSYIAMDAGNGWTKGVIYFWDGTHWDSPEYFIGPGLRAFVKNRNVEYLNVGSQTWKPRDVLSWDADIYISRSEGDDLDGYGTPNRPFKTMARALTYIQAEGLSKVAIHFDSSQSGADDFTVPDNLVLYVVGVSGPVWSASFGDITLGDGCQLHLDNVYASSIIEDVGISAAYLYIEMGYMSDLSGLTSKVDVNLFNTTVPISKLPAVWKGNGLDEDNNYRPFSNGLDMRSEKIVNVADPTTDQGAETKKHVSDNYIPLSQKGVANGVATLDGATKIPAGQLPSYVDDVEEYANFAAFPMTGETGKIYVAIDTGKTYRWTGTVYVEISPSEVNSVFTRIGAIVAVAGDYDASQVDNDSGVTGATVKAALDQLDSDLPVTATETTEGIAEIATQTETDTGTDDTRIVTPKKLAAYPFPDPTKTRRYNFSTRMRVGVGVGAAAVSLVQDVPCILFETAKDQVMTMANEIIPEIDLSSVNPKLRFHWLINTAAGVGTETTRLQLEIRYRGDDEGWDGAYDETLTIDIEIPTGTAFVRGHTDFTLDRTKIASNDGVSVKVTRLGTHGNDDYDSDFGINQVWLIYSGTGGE